MLKRRHIFVTGHGRHGKDTVAQLMHDYGGYRICDSSRFVCDAAVFPTLGPKYGYASPQECYEDRHQHRKEWFDLISAYNAEGHELAEALFQDHDVYTGLRSKRELDAFCALPDANPFVVWVDASDRLPPEPATSLTITAADAHWHIDNNGPEEELRGKVGTLLTVLAARMILDSAKGN